MVMKFRKGDREELGNALEVGAGMVLSQSSDGVPQIDVESSSVYVESDVDPAFLAGRLKFKGGTTTNVSGTAEIHFDSRYLNATNINAGTLADARLSSNVALEASANTFTDTQHITTAAGYNGDYALAIKQTADTNWRLFIQNQGTLLWGSGAGAADTNLYRSAANVLKTDDNFQAASYGVGTTEVISPTRVLQNVTIDASGIDRGTLADARLSTNVALENITNVFTAVQDIALGAAVASALRFRYAADTTSRLQISNAGHLEWGPGGTTAVDTILYRSTTNFLKTDGGFAADGNITNGGFDFYLGNTDQATRGNSGSSRALVKASGATLVLNFAGDFTGGVRVESALSMNSNRITSLANPSVAQDAATKAYVDNVAASKTTYSDLWNDMLLVGGNVSFPDSVNFPHHLQILNGDAYVTGTRAFFVTTRIDVRGGANSHEAESRAIAGGATVTGYYCLYLDQTYTEGEDKKIAFGVSSTGHARAVAYFYWDSTTGISGVSLTEKADLNGIDLGGVTLMDPYTAKLYAYVDDGLATRKLIYLADERAFWPTDPDASEALPNLGRTEAWGNRWGTFYGTSVDVTGSATIGGNLALTGTMTSGSVPDARLSTNVPLKNTNNILSGVTTVLRSGAAAVFNSGAATDARLEFQYNSTRVGYLTYQSSGVVVGADTGYTLALNAPSITFNVTPTVGGTAVSLAGHTHTFASLTSKPTDLAGYGITDAYTQTQANNTFANVSGDTFTGATLFQAGIHWQDGVGGRTISYYEDTVAELRFYPADSAGNTLSTTLSLQVYYNGAYYQVWHRGNDGTGSLLDADLLDGLHSTAFLRSDTANAVTNYANTVSFYSNTSGAATGGGQSSLQVYQGTAGADAFMAFHVSADWAVYFGLDGSTNDLFVGGWSLGAGKYKVWHAGNDGAGSTLNADLVDGLEASQFLRKDVSDTKSGDLNFGATTGQRINLWSTTYGFGVQNATQYVRTAGNFAVHKGGTHTDTELDSNGGVTTLWTDRFRADALHVRNGMWTHQHTGGNHRENRINSGLALPGRELNNNAEFHNGLNGYTVYDNNGSGRNVLSLQTEGSAGNSTGRRMLISYDPARSATAASPGFGGFYLGITGAGAAAGSAANFKQYRQGNRLIYRILAYIPSGRAINFASNSFGPSATRGEHWATSQDGISNWREYVYVQTIGVGGVNTDYDTTGFFYITGGSDVAFNWYVARCTVTAVDEADGPAYSSGLRVGQYFDQVLNNGEIIATGRIYARGGMHIHTEALWLYDMGGTGYGNMTIQGRVLSANNNIHLSPANGNNVIINTDYRGAGGTTGGVAGLTATGDIQGRNFKATGSLYRGSDDAYMQITNSSANFLTSVGGALAGKFGGILVSGNYSDARSYAVHVKGDIFADGGWVRVGGTRGLYLETYGGGWYMTDNDDLLVYNAKGIANIGTRGMVHTSGEANSGGFGLYWANTRSQAYAIYREAGAWTAPYPDLVINFHTGIKIGAHKTYGGTRFYNMDTVQAGVVEVMSVANGDEDVRVLYNLRVTGSTYSTTYYTTSSREVKHDIAAWDQSALGLLRGVEVVSFRYNEDPTELQVGFVAEDTHSLLAGLDQKRMKLGTVAGVLMAGVKELDARTETQEQKIERLERRVAELEAKVS